MTKFGVRRQAYHFALCVGRFGVGREEAGMVPRVSVRFGNAVSSGYSGKVEDSRSEVPIPIAVGDRQVLFKHVNEVGLRGEWVRDCYGRFTAGGFDGAKGFASGHVGGDRSG
jgi:hypothetical protein